MYNEREPWLAAASVLLQHDVFPSASIEAPQWEARRYRVACGFPIGYRGSRTGKVTLGQAFDPSISADGTFEVFINPILDNPLDVLGVLAHELVMSGPVFSAAIVASSLASLGLWVWKVR